MQSYFNGFLLHASPAKEIICLCKVQWGIKNYDLVPQNLLYYQNEQIICNLILLFDAKFYCFLVLHEHRNDNICLMKSFKQEVVICPVAQHKMFN